MILWNLCRVLGWTPWAPPFNSEETAFERLKPLFWVEYCLKHCHFSAFNQFTCWYVHNFGVKIINEQLPPMSFSIDRSKVVITMKAAFCMKIKAFGTKYFWKMIYLLQICQNTLSVQNRITGRAELREWTELIWILNRILSSGTGNIEFWKVVLKSPVSLNFCEQNLQRIT